LNKHFLNTLLSLLLVGFVSAQECSIKLLGKVIDEHTGSELSQVNIRILELKKGTVSSKTGEFHFDNLCAGQYHLVFSHVGCATVELFVKLRKDTLLAINLDHHHHLLDEVALTDEQGSASSQESRSIGKDQLSVQTDGDIAQVLETVSGVSLLSTGSNINKPIIHGLYGNRITILNNGVSQNGQQWGADHSPEIDFLVADRITVVKGVGALRYLGNSLGGVVLVEPESIPDEPHIHGQAKTYFRTNGRGGGLNLSLRQHTDVLAWKVVGTLKKMGDTHTPSYFLTNSGAQEANLALQLEKEWSEKWKSSFYFSSYNTTIGILRGSHIGNLTDLEEAIGRDKPFYTKDKFSYAIEAPYQKVNHQLWKLNSQHILKDGQWLDFSYAGQYDLRKEFDVRRSGRTEDPALSLKQWSLFLQGVYHQYLESGWELESGLQYQIVDNSNDPETGILPLIPDYISNEIGAFALVRKKWSRWQWEMGGRYDFEHRSVATISGTVPMEIIRYKEDYNNVSLMIGLKYHFSEILSMQYNLGWASRAPEVNELYSGGLHQGVGGIEEGDPNLGQEYSLKHTLSVLGYVRNNFFVEALVYYQQIDNYIFLNPQDEFRLTIRGAFPVFRYEQTNARLYGFDFSTTYSISESVQFLLKYAFLKGDDLSNGIPLNYMAPNNLFTELQWGFHNWGSWQKPEIRLNGRYVFEQTHILESQDYLVPPEAYFLLGMRASAEKQFSKYRLQTYVRVENMLNTTYRDYLNRQRYFADDLGLNVVLGFNFSF